MCITSKPPRRTARAVIHSTTAVGGLAFALAAYAGAVQAQTQNTTPAPVPVLPTASGTALRYDIAPGPLDHVLSQVAIRAHILLVMDAATLRNRQSGGLTGMHTPDSALNTLLGGTGMAAVRKSDGSFAIRPIVAADSSAAGTAESGAGNGTTLPEVTVRAGNVSAGIKRTASAGALGARSVLDTPFSVSVIDREDIQERQVTNLEQAFRYDAATTATASDYGRGSSIFVRGMGLDATNGFKLDGMAIPGWGNEVLPFEMFERVDLLKGLTGFMYGFGSPGGIMNYVLKRPTDENTFSADIGYKNGSLLSEHIDVGGRAGEGRLGYRVNYVHEQGNTYIDSGYLQRDAASVALDLKLTPDMTLTFDVLYALRKSQGNSFWGFALANGLQLPGHADPTIRTQPDGSYYNNENIMATTGLQWQLAPGWKASAAYRYAREDVDYVYSTLTIRNAAGDYNTSQSAGIYGFEFQQLQAMLEGEASTGDIRHQLVFGASRQEYASLSDRGGISTALADGNIYQPSMASANGANNSSHTMYRSLRINQNALFASDSLSFGDHWSTILGVRYTKFDQVSVNVAGLTTASYKRNPVTPTVALMYKPTDTATFYGSYVEALEKGGAAGVSNINFGETMGPMKSKQYEAGVKVAQDRWSATAALFRMQRTAEYTNAANYYVQDGETRYEGMDTSVRWEAGRDLTLAGGLMLLQTSYTDSAPALLNKRVTGAPNFQATAAVQYRVPGVAGLSLNGGARFVGASKLNTANTLDLPSYALMDLGAVYRTGMDGRELTLNAQVQNLANRRYWVYNGANYIANGAPRTLSLNARLEF